MSLLQLDLGEPLLSLLRQGDQPPGEAVREMVVIELYRRRSIPRGQAAKLLGLSLAEFLQLAGRRDVPYFDLTPEEIEAEFKAARQIAGER